MSSRWKIQISAFLSFYHKFKLLVKLIHFVWSQKSNGWCPTHSKGKYQSCLKFSKENYTGSGLSHIQTASELNPFCLVTKTMAYDRCPTHSKGKRSKLLVISILVQVNHKFKLLVKLIYSFLSLKRDIGIVGLCPVNNTELTDMQHTYS